MNKIASRLKRVTLSILSFLFIVEEVGLFAAAVIVNFQKDISNEFGERFILTFAFAVLGLSNLLAFSVTYFFWRKLLQIERGFALLWTLIPANIAPLVMIMWASRSLEYPLLYFFGTYALAVGLLSLIRIDASIECNDTKPSL